MKKEKETINDTYILTKNDIINIIRIADRYGIEANFSSYSEILNNIDNILNELIIENKEREEKIKNLKKNDILYLYENDEDIYAITVLEISKIKNRIVGIEKGDILNSNKAKYYNIDDLLTKEQVFKLHHVKLK